MPDFFMRKMKGDASRDYGLAILKSWNRNDCPALILPSGMCAMRSKGVGKKSRKCYRRICPRFQEQKGGKHKV